jgi:hypothetical protein
LEGWPTWKRSYPEDPALKNYLPDIRKICEWRDRHASGKAVWVTEFGYDSSTRKPDSNSEFRKWEGVSDLQQAQWIVRSWLVFSTLPVERAYLYFFNDEDQAQVHGSSGLTRHFQPKPSFYAAAHLQKTLGDFRFSRVVLEKPGEAMIYEFSHESDARQRIWVAWSPTGSGRTARIELPKFRGTIDHLERMPEARDEAVAQPAAVRDRQIAINESPLYLFLRMR